MSAQPKKRQWTPEQFVQMMKKRAEGTIGARVTAKELHQHGDSFRRGVEDRLLNQVPKIPYAKLAELAFAVPVLKESSEGRPFANLTETEFLRQLRDTLLLKRVTDLERRPAKHHQDGSAEFIAYLANLSEPDPLEVERELAEARERDKQAKLDGETAAEREVQEQSPRFDSEDKPRRARERDKSRHEFLPHEKNWFREKTVEEMRDALHVGRDIIGDFIRKELKARPVSKKKPYRYSVDTGLTVLAAWFRRPRWRKKNRRDFYLLRTLAYCEERHPEHLDKLKLALSEAIASVRTDYPDFDARLDKLRKRRNLDERTKQREVYPETVGAIYDLAQHYPAVASLLPSE